MKDQPPIGLSVSRGTTGRSGRYGRREVPDVRYPNEIKAAAKALHARGVPIVRIAEFFVVPYATAYTWLKGGWLMKRRPS